MSVGETLRGCHPLRTSGITTPSSVGDMDVSPPLDYPVPAMDKIDLAALPLRDFVSALGSDAPAPGGGSASAAAGAAGAALLGMAVKLTLGKEKYKDAWAE